MEITAAPASSQLVGSLLQPVIQLAHGAAALILDYYRGATFDVHTKADQSPVTSADLAADRWIREGLIRLTPDVGVVSEEHERVAFAQATRYWLVDPLDGTKEFLQRTDEFTVNIALIEHGRPLLGVVLAPALGSVCYFAESGEPAVKMQGCRTETIGTCSLPERWRVVTSRRHGELCLEPLRSFNASLSTHQMGSSLKICEIAEGRYDLYPRFGPTHLWDTAAAECILQAAGGQLLSLSGQPLHYDHTQNLINPDFIAVGDLAYPWKDVAATLAAARCGKA